MEEVTETKTTPLVSSADQSDVNMLLYQSLGDGTEKVYLYRTDDKQKEPKATGTKMKQIRLNKRTAKQKKSVKQLIGFIKMTNTNSGST